MPQTKSAPHNSVYLLADHLDTMLARGEDLLACHTDAAASQCDAGPQPRRSEARVLRFVAVVRSHEQQLIARTLKARELAERLVDADERYAAVARLFLAGTALLPDALCRTAADDEEAFDSGHDPVAFLRTRCVIAREAPCVPRYADLAVGEEFLVAGVLPLGPLMDHAAGVLDALELHHELFDAADAALLPDPGAEAADGAGSVGVDPPEPPVIPVPARGHDEAATAIAGTLSLS